MTPSFSLPFTFIQMNFWMGRLFYPIENFLNRERPDILSTQEMLYHPENTLPDYMTAKTLVDQHYFDEMILGGGMAGVSFSGKEQDIYCATFIRRPLICEQQDKILLYDTADVVPAGHYFGRENYYGLLHSQLRLQDGTLVHVLNHHGELMIGNRSGHPRADLTYKRIADYMANLSGPMILSGDFNLAKEATSLQPLKDLDLKNLNDIHHVSWARNEFSWNKYEAACHIFITDDIIVDDYHVAQDNVSDHLPLIMKARIRTA